MSTGDQLVRILWCCQWTQWTSLDLTVRSLNVYFEVSFLGWVCLNGLQHNLYSRCLQRSLFLISKKPFWVKILLCHPAPCGTSALGPHSFWGAKWNSWSNVMSRNDLILLSNLKLHVYVCKSYWFIQTLPKITPTDWHWFHPSQHLAIKSLPDLGAGDDNINGSIQRNIYGFFLGGWCSLVIYQQLYRIKVLCKANKNKAISRYNNCYGTSRKLTCRFWRRVKPKMQYF